MAFAAFGFKPTNIVSSYPGVGLGAIKFYVASEYGTTINTGDPVTLTGGVAQGDGVDVAIGVAGSTSAGVFWGVQRLRILNDVFTLASQAWIAGTVLENGTAALASVHTDPNILYEIVTSGSGVQRADVGLNANFAIGAGTNNISGTTLDMGSKAVTATLNCKILGIADKTRYPGNDFGATAGNVALVTINNHILRAGVAGIV